MALEGARVLLAPAAFNMTTGPAHWELLLRQRAVDNQCFTVGAAPAQDEAASYVAWGHSLVCDPWGTVLHECGSGEETAVVDLDLSRVDAVRQQLPILSPAGRIYTISAGGRSAIDFLDSQMAQFFKILVDKKFPLRYHTICGCPRCPRSADISQPQALFG